MALFGKRKALESKVRELETQISTMKKYSLSEYFEFLKNPSSSMASREGHISAPTYDLKEILTYIRINWMLSAVINKKINIASKDGGGFKPKYILKCTACSTEYQNKVETCKCGSTKFTEPDERQLKGVKNLFTKPNPGQTMKAFMQSWFYYSEGVDDYFIELVPPDGTKPGQDFAPTEMYVLSSEYMRIDASARKLGKGVFYCRHCYIKDTDKTDQTYDSKVAACPKCKGPLTETAYYQVDENDKVVARWGEKEVLHGNNRAYGSKLWGEPKAVAVLTIVQIMHWMDAYQINAYSMNRLPDGFSYFPGMSQTQVRDMLVDIENFKREHPEIKKHFALGVKEGSTPGFVKMMDTLVDLQARDMCEYYREAISVVYGVALASLGIQTPGKLGNETESMDVSYDAIDELQAIPEEEINAFLLPRFKVTDFIWRMENPKKDDLKRKAEIDETRARTAQTYISAGFDVKVTPDGIETSEKPVREMQQPSFGVMPPELMRKALSPRNIEPQDAVPGLRGIENAWVMDAKGAYDPRGIADALRTNNPAAIEAATSALLNELYRKLVEQAQRYAELEWIAGMNSAGEDVFSQTDVNALNVLINQGDALIPSFKGFCDQQRDIIMGEIERGYRQSLDVGQMTSNLVKTVGGEQFKLERIIRTETTRISNMGRYSVWKDLGKGEQYDWVDSKGAMPPPCPVCKSIAMNGPYEIELLRQTTNDFVPHPNCRCTMVRRVRV